MNNKPNEPKQSIADRVVDLVVERDRRQRLDAMLPSVVCLCGSTRFMDAFHEAGWQLTLEGHIVLSVGVCKHAEHHGGEALSQKVADQLDKLHLRKIDMADWVLILNVDGYIGESTKKELDYGIDNDKRVMFLEPIKVATSERPEKDESCP